MKLSPDLLESLKLQEAAVQVTTKNLDRLPVLISERALTETTGKLAGSVNADFSSGTRVSSTTFSMPRKGFGPRPVTVLSGRDRALFDALVDRLRPALPPESRGTENWAAFSRFGLPQDDPYPKYVVSIDIASMYEYVDHQVLKRELLVQTLDRPSVEAIIDLLGEAFSFARGLPQMTSASDLLGDVYLGILERELLRQGYELARFADDFRVLAQSWGEAHQIIEHAAEAARSIGLVLSSEKTTVRLASTLHEDEEALQALVDKYFKEAMTDLTVFDDVMDWYGESGEVEIEPTEPEALHEAFRRLLQDWTADPRDSGVPPRLISKAIRSLGPASTRISDDVLTQMVWIDPLKLSSIIAYFSKRSDEAVENLKSLVELVTMERQSPWAKIWLLSAAEAAIVNDSAEWTALRDWVFAQLKDEHEIVRAEAAWVLTGWDSLSESSLGDLFGRATRITRPGLAAALGRSGASRGTSLTKSIIGASPLFKAAHEWGSRADASGT